MNPPNGLQVKNLSVSYSEDSFVFEGVSFALPKGSLGCLFGPSGCGKTSLLRSVAGFVQPKEGAILLEGEDLRLNARKEVPPEKRGVGIVFQDYALFPHLSVKENILFGLTGSSWSNKEKKESRLREVLELTQLTDKVNAMPGELSGGQQQRVAIARALAPKPRVLLLDEPFSHLDANLREKVAAELKELLQMAGVTTLVVTHNQSEVFDLADYVGVLHGGKLLQWGSVKEVYRRPNHRKVAEQFGQYSYLPVFRTGNYLSSPFAGKKKFPIKESHCAINKDGDQGVLLLRPEEVVQDHASELEATVIRSFFRGHYTLVHLELADGVILKMLTDEVLTAGEAVPIGIKPVSSIAFK